MPTATGLRISSVDGTAFLDNCPADILAAVGAQVKIYDASSRYLLGYVGAVGSSEGLGSERASALQNSATNPFETFSATGQNITQAKDTRGGNYYFCGSPTANTQGELVKVSMSNTIVSGTFGLYIGTSLSGISGGITLSSGLSSGAFSSYKTITNSNQDVLGYYVLGISEMSATDVSLKNVTAPSSSGVTILDAIGGNQNFISKDASFTYNAASYTYEIIYPTTKRRNGLLLGVY